MSLKNILDEKFPIEEGINKKGLDPIELKLLARTLADHLKNTGDVSIDFNNNGLILSVLGDTYFISRSYIELKNYM